MKEISVDQIQVSATPGASADDAIEEAIRMAVTEHRNVELRHNAVVYTVNFEDICELVHRTGVERKK